MQLTLELKRHGGKRRGAGRKRRDGSREPNHAARGPVRSTDGVHCVLRTLPDVPRLRCAAVLRAIAEIIEVCGKTDVFRIVHFSIQHNHVHVVVEAEDRESLSKGMQAFAQRLARAINTVFGRAGKVFAFRYHSTVFRSPRHARRVVAYVLGNWRHHREDERSREAHEALIDPYSSGPQFDGWKQAVSYSHLVVGTASPKSWLLQAGWRDRGGGRLDCWATPGPA